MDLAPSARATDLVARVRAFVAEEIAPIEADYHRSVATLRETGGDPWDPLPVLGELRAKARAAAIGPTAHTTWPASTACNPPSARYSTTRRRRWRCARTRRSSVRRSI